MKLIPFDTEQLLDKSDALKVQAYKAAVKNAAMTRFSGKINIDGMWYMHYSESLSKYYTVSEISRIIELKNDENS